jgi:osmotically-inducible protein OsmY
MAAKADREVKLAIEAELHCHPDVDETHIAVEVLCGSVRLSGHVRNLFDKYGAEDAVRRVAGVNAIANDITVRSPTPARVAAAR